MFSTFSNYIKTNLISNNHFKGAGFEYAISISNASIYDKQMLALHFEAVGLHYTISISVFMIENFFDVTCKQG